MQGTIILPAPFGITNPWSPGTTSSENRAVIVAFIIGAITNRLLQGIQSIPYLEFHTGFCDTSMGCTAGVSHVNIYLIAGFQIGNGKATSLEKGEVTVSVTIFHIVAIFIFLILVAITVGTQIPGIVHIT